MTVFYNFSGGMESAAMLVLEADRIKSLGAIVRWADTGKHFPEMYESIREIEAALSIPIVTVPRRITFEEFLFERGGMIRKGTTDCSRRMKRSNLGRHMRTFARPYEVNLGFNAGEAARADSFAALNERPWLHWRFPLIDHGITRSETSAICASAGFTVLGAMYLKMGRLDCFFCGNQTPAQARLVHLHYPALGGEWLAMEARKGHSFMPIWQRDLIDAPSNDTPGSGCGCFGGADDFAEDIEEDAA